MKKDDFLQEMEKTFDDALALVKIKNEDYAKGSDAFANFKMTKLIGIDVPDAILVRVCDKMSRVANILQKGEAKVKDETVEDTLVDIINYIAILKVYLNSP